MEDVPSLLLDPGLLHKIKLDLDHFIVGEDKNKLLLFLIGLTSFSNTPLGALITGESSAGKSHLMDKVLQFFPNVEEYTRMTQASPDRIGQNFSNKILKVGEIYGVEKAQATLRVLISEGKLRLLTTAIDDETGKMTTTTIETNGVPCFITTTTSFNPDKEMMNRLFLISVDEGKEQTRNILRYEAREFAEFEDEAPKPSMEITEAVNTLGSNWTYVKIPFAPLLSEAFPCDTVKARRDFKKLLWITASVAYLYQFQRPRLQNLKAKWKGFFTVALPIDFCMAWSIAEAGMKETLLGVQNRALKILATFKVDDDKTTRDVATENDFSQDTASRILNTLVRAGFLTRNEEKRPYKYSLLKTVDNSNRTNVLLSALTRFGENELKAWLDGHTATRKIMGAEAWKDSFVDPISGNVVSLTDFTTRGEMRFAVSSSEPKSDSSTTNNANLDRNRLMLSNSEGAQKSAEMLKKLREGDV